MAAATATIRVVNNPEVKTVTPRSKPSRAAELWDLLRKSVKHLTDLVKKADIKPSTVTHGVHHIRKINHEEPVNTILYNSTQSEIVTVDGRYINIHHSDGRRKDFFEPEESIMRMVWCKKSNQYVAQIAPKEMKLLTSDLEYVSTSKFHHDVKCMAYNECANELITAGSGNLATWCFRYGNRYFIPHKIVVEGLKEEDQFTLLALEGSESLSQRCFAVCGTSVAVFNLHKGKLLDHKKDLHVRSITSIAFINPLKYLVTGSKDGSIKLWDMRFDIKHVFVGHYGPVKALAIYPLGPYFMSASHDSTIRVWSLNHCDEVDLLECDEPVEGLQTLPGIGKLFSYSAFTVDLWDISHLHQIFTTTSAKALKLNTVYYSKLIDRTVAQCEDGSVRIICPTNGCVVTSIIPPWIADEDDRPNLLDAVYHLPHEFAYISYDNGVMLKANTATNPAKIVNSWNFDEDSLVNCLCLYEYILDPAELLTKWEEMKKQKPPERRRNIKKQNRYGNKIILLAGLKSGVIAIVSKVHGNIIFQVEAHEKHEILSILAHPQNDQVITAGKDNTVKVWKMFPNTVESLSLMMSFFCSNTPTHMTVCNNTLVVAFQQQSTAIYTIVVYDLVTKERYDHSPDFDHTNEITGLTFCPRLKLFASSSKDNTIRIWNRENELVRVLKLNDEPNCLTFSSQRGDIIVGLRQNIHFISHEHFMPQSYMFKMVCMEFPDPKYEDPIPINKQELKKYTKESTRMLKKAKSSYMKFDYSWDPMSLEEEEENIRQQMTRDMMFAELAAKESEIYKIRDGLVHPTNYGRISTKRTEARAFRKYMEMIWRKPKVKKVPEVDDFTPDPPEEKKLVIKEYAEETKIGFFPPIKSAKPIQEIIKGKENDKYLHDSGPDFNPSDGFPINPQGFIPNSILMRFLWPQEEMEKQQSLNIYKPPDIPPEMQAHLDEVSKEPIPEIEDEDEENVFMMPTPSDGSLVDEDIHFQDSFGPSAGVTGKEKKKELPKTTSKLMEKLQKAMKTPTPPPTPEISPTPPPPPSVEKKHTPPRRPSKPIEKLISRPPPPSAAVKTVPQTSTHNADVSSSLPAPKTKLHTTTTVTKRVPTPTPPATPTPSFMTQFEGAAWFGQYQTLIMQKMTKPYEASKFMIIVADILGQATNWNVRKQIVDGMLLLWQQESGLNGRYALTALLSILNHTTPPSPKDSEQAAFLREAVKLYQVLQGTSEDFFIEILSQYLEGDSHHRSFINGVLIDMGLQDSHSYLNKELDSWELWNLTDSMPMKPQIKNMVKKWIHEWKEKFREHLERMMADLKRGDVKGTMIKSNISTPVPNLRKQPQPSSRGHRVRFTVAATEQSLKNVTTIEVCNYFCEVQLEHDLDKIHVKSTKPQPKKNTVLVLPKVDGPQALVRLGEMHTAHRARVRDNLAAEYKLNALQRPYPNLMDQFASKIILPANILHMNPFPSVVDEYENDTIFQPILLTLRSVHQRYFVPEKSYVHLS